MSKTGRTTWHRSVYQAAAILGLGLMLGLVPRAARAVCTGDCDNSGDVQINEIITCVNIALGTAVVSTCSACDPDNSGDVQINEIIQAVNAALTSCPVPTGACGDGVKNGSEDCDVGGTCVGGMKASTACTKDSDCLTGTDTSAPANTGICLEGSKTLTVCSSDSDCPASKCVRCKTFGGAAIPGDSTHTCSATCSFETTVPYDLVAGVVSGTDIQPGTSGAVVHGEILTIPLPLVGGQTLLVGKQTTDGKIAAVIPADSVQLPAIPVSTIACACVRGAAAKTCGGTIFEADGSLTADCTPVFTAGDSVCAGGKPCTFVHGAGNSASGFIYCNAGASGIDVTQTQNAGGSSGVAGPPVLTFSGSNAPAGSALIANTQAIGTVVGACAGTDPAYGADGQFCTPDDPASSRGTPSTLPNTTGKAIARIDNANATDDDTIGPFDISGTSFSCSALAGGSASGVSLAGAFTSLAQPTVGDIVVTSLQKSQ